MRTAGRAQAEGRGYELTLVHDTAGGRRPQAGYETHILCMTRPEAARGLHCRHGRRQCADDACAERFSFLSRPCFMWCSRFLYTPAIVFSVLFLYFCVAVETAD